MAERQVVHLARLIDDLMDVSRISRGKIELRKEPSTWSPSCERAVEAVRSPIRGARHTTCRSTCPTARSAWRPTRPGWSRSSGTC